MATQLDASVPLHGQKCQSAGPALDQPRAHREDISARIAAHMPNLEQIKVVNEILLGAGHTWLDALNFSFFFSEDQSFNSAQKIFEGVDIDSTNDDKKAVWKQINRFEIKQFPWTGNIFDSAEKSQRKEVSQNKQGGVFRDILNLWLERDLLDSFCCSKLKVLLYTVLLLLHFVNSQVILMKYWEYLVLIGWQLAIIQAILSHQVKLSHHIQQWEMVYYACCVLNHQSTLVNTQVHHSFEQSHLPIFLYLCNIRINLFDQQFAITAKKMIGIKHNQIPHCFLLTILGIILFQLPIQFSVFYLVAILKKMLNNFLQRDLLYKLIDFNQKSADEMEQNNCFIAGIVHDLRGPISCIKMFLETLENQLPKKVIRGSLHQQISSCMNSSTHITQMVSNILDLSKLKENKFELNCRPENIKHLVIQAVDLHQTKIEQKGIFIDCFQSSPNVFPEEFQLDACRVSQIINNLVGNATKFTQAGGIKIMLTWQPTKKQPLSQNTKLSQAIKFYTSSADSKSYQHSGSTDKQQQQKQKKGKSMLVGSLDSIQDDSREIGYDDEDEGSESESYDQKVVRASDDDDGIDQEAIEDELEGMEDEMEEMEAELQEIQSKRLQQQLQVEEDEQDQPNSSYDVAKFESDRQQAEHVSDHESLQSSVSHSIEDSEHEQEPSEQGIQQNEAPPPKIVTNSQQEVCDISRSMSENLSDGMDLKLLPNSSYMQCSMIPNQKQYNIMQGNEGQTIQSNQRVFLGSEQHVSQGDVSQNFQNSPIFDSQLRQINSQSRQVDKQLQSQLRNNNFQRYQSSGQEQQNVLAQDKQVQQSERQPAVQPELLPVRDEYHKEAADQQEQKNDSNHEEVQEEQKQIVNDLPQREVAVRESQQSLGETGSNAFKFNQLENSSDRNSNEADGNLSDQNQDVPDVENLSNELVARGLIIDDQDEIESNQAYENKFARNNSQQEEIKSAKKPLQFAIVKKDQKCNLKRKMKASSDSFNLGRLNKFDTHLKKVHNGSVSLQSHLPQIDENRKGEASKVQSQIQIQRHSPSKLKIVTNFGHNRKNRLQKKAIQMNQTNQAKSDPVKIAASCEIEPLSNSNLRVSRSQRALSAQSLKVGSQIVKEEPQKVVDMQKAKQKAKDSTQLLEKLLPKNKGTKNQNLFYISQSHEDLSLFKYTPMHDVESRKWEDGILTIDVIDNGIGISAAEQSKLFKPYNQANGSSSEYGGTGLGLWISKQMAQLMNGDLSLYSAGHGTGSTFTFKAPVKAKISASKLNKTGAPGYQPQQKHSFDRLHRTYGIDNYAQQCQSQKIYVISDPVTVEAINSQLQQFELAKVERIKNQEQLEAIRGDPILTRIIFIDSKIPYQMRLTLVEMKQTMKQLFLVFMSHTQYSTNQESELGKLADYKMVKTNLKPEMTTLFQHLQKLNIQQAQEELKESQVSEQVEKEVVEPPEQPKKEEQKVDTKFAQPKHERKYQKILENENYNEVSLNILEVQNQSQDPEEVGEGRMINSHNGCVDKKDKKSMPLVAKGRQLTLKGRMRNKNKSIKTCKSSKQLLHKKHMFVAQSLQCRIYQLIKSQIRFTNAADVPPGSPLIIVIDDDDFVRMTTQQNLMYQFRLHQFSQSKKRMDIALSLGQTQKQFIQKLTIDPFYMVEASSGEELISIFKTFLTNKCRVLLVLLDINMGSDKLRGYQAAQQIREIEASFEHKPSEQTVIVGHSGNDAQQMVQEDLVNKYMDTCCSKPLQISVVQHLVRIMNVTKQNQELFREKMMSVFESNKK